MRLALASMRWHRFGIDLAHGRSPGLAHSIAT
jgi:hypothetical protein